MKQNASIIYSLLLVIGDFLALIAAFTTAYILRVKFDTRPLIQQIPAETYFYGFLAVLPLWILVHGFIGLYRREIYDNRFREFGRLILGSSLGMLVVIGYDFIIDDSLFPARLVAVYGLVLSFSFLVIFRMFARGFRSLLFSFGYGVNNVLLIGGGASATSIIEELQDTHRSGHRIVGIVGGEGSGFKHFANFEAALDHLQKTPVHSIIQTELYKKSDLNDEIMNYAQSRHMSYRFIPGNDELFVGNIEVELFKGTPVVTVHQTALIGWGHIVKRIFDLVFGGIALIIASPILIVVALLQKLTLPSAPVLLKQTRLTQFNRTFTVYKFRSFKPKFNGLSPEEAFEKMGKPELAKKYRAGGDHIPNDPRVTRLGRFLRITSLDELPQLINVVRGDISLVGPRALVPEELKGYTKKHHILSIKSGLTGLAQVSGRRNISFEERRKLDLYYVQNWSFWLDLVIILKTLRAVINGIGAK
jgi:exopolysaccharide biosynthesis polyprenyl glycosylphosphotransferase